MMRTFNTEKKNVGSAIKELMRLQGITGGELAEALGTTAPTIYGKLNKRGISADDLIRILNVLGFQLAAVEDADLVKIFTLDMCGPAPRQRNREAMEKYYKERYEKYHTPQPRPYDPAIEAAYERSAEKRRAQQLEQQREVTE